MTRARYEPTGLELVYQDQTGVPSVGCVVAIYKDYPAPVGVLWYRHVMRDLMEIVNVYTHEFYRRRGIATAMLKRLVEWYPERRVCTAKGNRQSRPWLVKNGFRESRQGWFLISVAPQPKPTQGRRRTKKKAR